MFHILFKLILLLNSTLILIWEEEWDINVKCKKVNNWALTITLIFLKELFGRLGNIQNDGFGRSIFKSYESNVNWWIEINRTIFRYRYWLPGSNNGRGKLELYGMFHEKLLIKDTYEHGFYKKRSLAWLFCSLRGNSEWHRHLFGTL